ncbi:PAP15 [Scenedesmus sp. PABB004]|nr:PAP15 [Scenedesmus sp. PABB004]
MLDPAAAARGARAAAHGRARRRRVRTAPAGGGGAERGCGAARRGAARRGAARGRGGAAARPAAAATAAAAVRRAVQSQVVAAYVLHAGLAACGAPALLRELDDALSDTMLALQAYLTHDRPLAAAHFSASCLRTETLPRSSRLYALGSEIARRLRRLHACQRRLTGAAAGLLQHCSSAGSGQAHAQTALALAQQLARLSASVADLAGLKDLRTPLLARAALRSGCGLLAPLLSGAWLAGLAGQPAGATGIVFALVAGAICQVLLMTALTLATGLEDPFDTGPASPPDALSLAEWGAALAYLTAPLDDGEPGEPELRPEEREAAQVKHAHLPARPVNDVPQLTMAALPGTAALLVALVALSLVGAVTISPDGPPAQRVYNQSGEVSGAVPELPFNYTQTLPNGVTLTTVKTAPGCSPEQVSVTFYGIDKNGYASVLVSWATCDAVVQTTATSANCTGPAKPGTVTGPLSTGGLTSQVYWVAAASSHGKTRLSQGNCTSYVTRYAPQYDAMVYASPLLHHVLLVGAVPAQQAAQRRSVHYADRPDYAGTTPPGCTVCNASGGAKGFEYSPRWDTWGRLFQPLMSAVPTIMITGNHELCFEPDPLAAPLDIPLRQATYNARYPQAVRGPRNAPDATTLGPATSATPWANAYYSVSVPGVATWIGLSSYSPAEIANSSTSNGFTKNSAQYKWLQRTLAMYEPLLLEASVDIVLLGHVHAYERTKPVADFQVDGGGCAPMYVTIGDGGNVEGVSSEFITANYTSKSLNCDTPETYKFPSYQPQQCFTYQSGPGSGCANDARCYCYESQLAPQLERRAPRQQHQMPRAAVAGPSVLLVALAALSLAGAVTISPDGPPKQRVYNQSGEVSGAVPELPFNYTQTLPNGVTLTTVSVTFYGIDENGYASVLVSWATCDAVVQTTATSANCTGPAKPGTVTGPLSTRGLTSQVYWVAAASKGSKPQLSQGNCTSYVTHYAPQYDAMVYASPLLHHVLLVGAAPAQRAAQRAAQRGPASACCAWPLRRLLSPCCTCMARLGLKPGVRYNYTVVDSVLAASSSGSTPRPLAPGETGPHPFSGQFIAPGAAPGQSPFPFQIGVIGDPGQTANTTATLQHLMAPWGLTAPRRAWDEGGMNLLMIQGDYTWDTWGRLFQPLMSAVPTIMITGNHELCLKPDPLAAPLDIPLRQATYNARYPQATRGPRNAPDATTLGPVTSATPWANAYYSVSVPGVATWIGLSSYSPAEIANSSTSNGFTKNSAQYKWLQRTLAVYEPLLLEASVDIVLLGHVHAYERTKPVADFQVDRGGCAPMHVTIGDAGNVEGVASAFITANVTGKYLSCSTPETYKFPSYQPQSCLSFHSGPGSGCAGGARCFCYASQVSVTFYGIDENGYASVLVSWATCDAVVQTTATSANCTGPAKPGTVTGPLSTRGLTSQVYWVAAASKGSKPQLSQGNCTSYVTHYAPQYDAMVYASPLLHHVLLVGAAPAQRAAQRAAQRGPASACCAWPLRRLLSPCCTCMARLGLKPGVRYNYTVVDSVLAASSSGSTPRPLAPGETGPHPFSGQFIAPGAAPGQSPFPFQIGVIGDPGQTANTTTVMQHLMAPWGLTAPRRAWDKGGMDLLMIQGDLSYADQPQIEGTVPPGCVMCNASDGPEDFDYGPRWDTWGRLFQPLMSAVPTIMIPGNHECGFEPDPLAAALDIPLRQRVYNARYPQAVRGPRNAPDATTLGPATSATPWANAYYSVSVPGVATWVGLSNYSPAEIANSSSNNGFTKNSAQHKWLQRTLAAVNRTATPWVIVSLHAPWYNTYTEHFKENECMRQVYEPLLLEASVDIVLLGHVHAYERIKPLADFQVDNRGCAPMHVTIGDAGNSEDVAKTFVTANAARGHHFNCSKPVKDFTYAFPAYQPQSCLSFQSGPGSGCAGGARCFCYASQPAWSAYREPSFGHGRLYLNSATSAVWQWFRNDGGVMAVTDEVTITRDPRCTRRR